MERHLFRGAALLCLSSSVLPMASIESAGTQLWHFLIFLAFASGSRKEVGSTWFNIVQHGSTRHWSWNPYGLDSGVAACKLRASCLCGGPPSNWGFPWGDDQTGWFIGGNPTKMGWLQGTPISGNLQLAHGINTGNPIRSKPWPPPSLAKRHQGTAEGKCLQRMNPANLRDSSKLFQTTNQEDGCFWKQEPPQKVTQLLRVCWGNCGFMGNQIQTTPTSVRPKWRLGVSTNGGTPKSSLLNGTSFISHPFWDAPIYRNPHLTF